MTVLKVKHFFTIPKPEPPSTPSGSPSLAPKARTGSIWTTVADSLPDAGLAR